MQYIFSYVISRFSEASTWATVVAFASAQLHINMSQDMNNWLIQLGVFLATGAGILIREGHTPPSEQG